MQQKKEQKTIQIKQLVAAPDGAYALDVDGYLWYYMTNQNKWVLKPLPRALTPEQKDKILSKASEAHI